MRVVMVGNGKGGVGKTSTAVNFADCAARAGWRTLLVDLDPQGSVAADLGVESDDGEALLTAVISPRSGLEVTPSGRPNLDIVPAGTRTRDLLDHIQNRRNRTSDPNEYRAVRKALAVASADYDLIVLDTQPGDAQTPSVRAGLAAADYLVTPTNPDSESIGGLAQLATATAELRAQQVTHVQLIAVLLHNLNPAAKKIRSDATRVLTELLGDENLVLPVFIRSAQKAAVDQRDQSLTAWEYAEKAANSPRWWENKNAATYSQAAANLAADYHNASSEILRRIASAPEPEVTLAETERGNTVQLDRGFLDDVLDGWDDAPAAEETMTAEPTVVTIPDFGEDAPGESTPSVTVEEALPLTGPTAPPAKPIKIPAAKTAPADLGATEPAAPTAEPSKDEDADFGFDDIIAPADGTATP